MKLGLICSFASVLVLSSLISNCKSTGSNNDSDLQSNKGKQDPSLVAKSGEKYNSFICELKAAPIFVSVIVGTQELKPGKEGPVYVEWNKSGGGLFKVKALAKIVESTTNNTRYRVFLPTIPAVSNDFDPIMYFNMQSNHSLAGSAQFKVKKPSEQKEEMYVEQRNTTCLSNDSTMPQFKKELADFKVNVEEND